MNFSLINKAILTFLCFILLSACNSTKDIYKNLKTSKFDTPVIENLDDKKIFLNSTEGKKINYDNKITLSDLKNKKQYNTDTIILNDKFYALNKDNNILEFDSNTGELTSTKVINILNIIDERIVSFNYLNNSFIIALKSGLIFNIDLNGQLIWKFESNKTLNTPLYFFDEQIIALYVDGVYNISSKDGSLIWVENYNDLPVYQAKGGQLVNFLNLLFFILPNNQVGSIDLNFGSPHDFIFNEIPLISSINNTKDEIHVFNNYFTYLDEGKYLYTVDILNNKFNLFKKNIKSYSSNIFFNNALIIKQDNYLHAINIINGKSFWLIENKNISLKSKLVAIRSINENIEIFLDDGNILIINDKKLIEFNNLNINHIKSIMFDNNNMIINTDNEKTVIF